MKKETLNIILDRIDLLSDILISTQLESNNNELEDYRKEELKTEIKTLKIELKTAKKCKTWILNHK